MLTRPMHRLSLRSPCGAVMFDAAVGASRSTAKEQEAAIQHNRELSMRSLAGEYVDPAQLKPATLGGTRHVPSSFASPLHFESMYSVAAVRALPSALVHR